MSDEIEPAIASPRSSDERKAVAVLRVFRAANLRAAFAFDDADAERLWGVKLAQFSLGACLKAADDWIETGERELPTLAQFEDLAEFWQREVERLQNVDPLVQTERERTGECPECGNDRDNTTDGWVWLSDPNTPGMVPSVRPCSQCKPIQFELWRAGHYKPRDTARCRCGNMHCPDEQRRRRRAA